MTTLLVNPHKTPEELKDLAGNHSATCLEDILPYALFRALYTKWTLPKDRLVKQDEIPNRDKVKEEAFCMAISQKNGDTAGGMQGITYAMMKAWPEDITCYVYDLLCSLWREKMVPG